MRDELFIFPFLTLRMPVLTRALLRYATGAWSRASHQPGAMFPWESGFDGREESQRIHLNPMSGRWIPDNTWRQRHIGAAIAYNVWEYFEATDDREFLRDYGAAGARAQARPGGAPTRTGAGIEKRAREEEKDQAHEDGR